MTKAQWEAAHIIARYIKDKTVRWNDFDKVVCPPEKLKGIEKLFSEVLQWNYCEEELYLVRAKSIKGAIRFIRENCPLNALRAYIKEIDEETQGEEQ